jgi:hypothetical protein
VRYAGCWAPQSTLRDAIIPTPRQQGADESEPSRAALELRRLLKRVFALELGTCPLCQRGTLQIIAAITQAVERV